MADVYFFNMYERFRFIKVKNGLLYAWLLRARRLSKQDPSGEYGRKFNNRCSLCVSRESQVFLKKEILDDREKVSLLYDNFFWIISINIQT